jgi:hypothetical protein
MGVVTYAYNPSYFRGKDRRITVQGQPRQKVSETPSSIRQVRWLILVIPAMQKAIGRRITVRG